MLMMLMMLMLMTSSPRILQPFTLSHTFHGTLPSPALSASAAQNHSSVGEVSEHRMRPASTSKCPSNKCKQGQMLTNVVSNDQMWFQMRFQMWFPMLANVWPLYLNAQGSKVQKYLALENIGFKGVESLILILASLADVSRQTTSCDTCGFPKIGVPPNHPY